MLRLPLSSVGIKIRHVEALWNKEQVNEFAGITARSFYQGDELYGTLVK